MEEEQGAAVQLCEPEKWVEQHGDCLFRYALLRLRNREVAEEVIQETLLAALQSREQFNGQSSERTWLIGILKHKIIDHYRRKSREGSSDAAHEPLPWEQEELFRVSGQLAGHWKERPLEWGTDPSAALEKKEFWKALDRCLVSMPPRMAQIFVLREMEEMSTEELCKLFEISPSNLWVLLHRARMHLRRCLEQEYFAKQAA